MKKGIVFVIISLFMTTLSYAGFGGSYEGTHKSKKITAKIKETASGITGSVTYGKKRYTLKAKIASDSMNEAKGHVVRVGEKREVFVERVYANIKITLYPKSMKDKMVSTKLIRVQKKTNKKRVSKKISKKAKKSLVGRWINDGGDLDLRRDGSYVYQKTVVAAPIIKKRDFKKPSSTNSNSVKINVDNTTVQIGNSNLGNTVELGLKGETTGTKKWRDKYKKNYHLPPKEEKGASLSSFGYWKAKNRALYITYNGGSTSTFFGQYSLNSSSLIIVKSNGAQLIFYRVR